ncbi:MAG TPA: hypothetical protein VJ910_03405 [Desulfuromonadales bacterium]|nr:hypothetical protein [Desulfuromonadales bacterium]
MSEGFAESKRKGRIEVHLRGSRVGKDLHLAIFGGDRPHIGAVAMSYPHPGLKVPDRFEVTTSVLTVTGHKEDLLARHAAHRIAGATGCTTSVSCGIHVDQITRQEIRTVQRLVDRLVDDLVTRLQAG